MTFQLCGEHKLPGERTREYLMQCAILKNDYSLAQVYYTRDFTAEELVTAQAQDSYQCAELITHRVAIGSGNRKEAERKAKEWSDKHKPEGFTASVDVYPKKYLKDVELAFRRGNYAC